MSPRQGELWEREGFGIIVGGLRVTGQPSLAAWGRAMHHMARSRSAFQWAVGDMLLYADTRGWNEAEVEAIMDTTGLKRGTLLNLKSVAKSFPMARRRPDLPWSHHQLVASLEAEEADAMLDQSAEHSWGWEELREHARTARHEARRTVQTFPDGTYGLLMATPPWRSITTPRHVMSVDQIAAMAPQVQAVTAPDAVIYLDTAFGQIEDGLTVLRAWGFTVRGHHAVIHPVTETQGDYARVRHSVILIGTRGRPVPPTMPPDSVIAGETLADVLERTYAGVPRVALFSEVEREGWVKWDHRPQEEPEGERAIRIVEREPELETEQQTVTVGG